MQLAHSALPLYLSMEEGGCIFSLLLLFKKVLILNRSTKNKELPYTDNYAYYEYDNEVFDSFEFLKMAMYVFTY